MLTAAFVGDLLRIAPQVNFGKRACRVNNPHAFPRSAPVYVLCRHPFMKLTGQLSADSVLTSAEIDQLILVTAEAGVMNKGRELSNILRIVVPAVL